MENRSIAIELPKGVNAYIFGSFLRSDFPNDIDILFEYDAIMIPSAEVYSKIQNTIQNFEKTFDLTDHPLVLSINEIKESGMIDKNK